MDTSEVTLDIQVHVPDNTPTDAKLYMPNSDDGWDPATITLDADTTLERVDANTFHIRVTRPRAAPVWSTSSSAAVGTAARPMPTATGPVIASSCLSMTAARWTSISRAGAIPTLRAKPRQ